MNETDATEHQRAPSPSSPRAGTAPLLALEDVTVRFGGVTALEDVALRVEAGEVVGLIGPNGAGKTTLFDVISGVRAPDHGRVHFAGTDVTAWSAIRLARAGLRRTFQRVQLFGWLSVEDNVLTSLEWRGGGGGMAADLVGLPTRRRHERTRRRQAATALAHCGLDDVAPEPAASLPIGQARLVELARALAEPPRMLLLDEPTSGLGERETHEVARRIRHARDTHESAVLVVEHDIGFVMDVCDRIVVLDVGRVIAAGNAEEIRNDETVRSAYLGDTI